MSKFLVLSLPRSRSAWMAHWLSYPGKLVGHDIGVEAKSVDQFLAHFAHADGSVETGAMIGWRLIKHHLPELKTLVVLRDPHEVLLSLAKFGLSSPGLTEEITSRFHMLNAISSSEGVETIDSSDLDDDDLRSELFEYLLDIPFDEDWDARFAQVNIQIDFHARMRQLQRNHQDLERFKHEVVAQQQKIGLSQCPVFN